MERIKSCISLQTVTSSAPTVLSLDDGETITNPNDIANIFNNYFACTLPTKRNVKYSYEYFSDCP